MGEMSKQVRVDNWGVFFLQRLQSFFNKTDYCDLTLQFEGNVQLKVHRLVMYTCTDYFHILEQTCDVSEDNVLIMPPDLQADVIVPIVNFMYTGTLEFQFSMFDRLYQTATLMNITILTKLLEAQRKPMMHRAMQARKQQQQLERRQHYQQKERVGGGSGSGGHLPATLPGRKLPVWKRKVVPGHLDVGGGSSRGGEYSKGLLVSKSRGHQSSATDPLALIYDNAPKPTRFEWPEEELSAFNPLDSTFDDISYTSRPLLTREDEERARAAAGTSDDGKRSPSPEGRRMDVDDIKDYVKEQKIRLDFEDEESADNDLMSIDSVSSKRKLDNASPTSSTSSNKRVRFSVIEKENKETKLNITSASGKSPPDMDHAKIISELLKKYPDLVKKNKNIRLKIMAKNPNSDGKNLKQVSKVRVQLSPKTSPQPKIKEEPKKDEGPWVCNLCSNSDERVEFVLYYLYRKHMTDVHNEKFDSRMCKFCGHKSNKHNMLMYHMYTKHGVKPPPAYNFPKCNQCHYIALTEMLLVKHKLNHTKFESQCRECKVAFKSVQSLINHERVTGHAARSGRTSYDCQYCMKHYQTGANLFSHIKMQHREEANRDGIISIDEIDEHGEDDDEEESEETKQQIREEDEYITPELIHETKTKEKFKILQNVKVPLVTQDLHHHSEEPPADQQTVTLEPSSEAEALSNVASGIATSLGLVDIVVLNDNQQFILQPNEQLQNSQSEFILPELDSSQFTTADVQNQGTTGQHDVIAQSMLNSGDIASTDELVMVLTDHDYGDGNNELIGNDNSNIVVLYSHPVDGQENQFITSQGNLMVNSQTGMIEIRNGSATAITTSTADVPPNAIVVTSQAQQDSHIESIEMIQQEIQSHVANTVHHVDHQQAQQQQQQQQQEEQKQQEEQTTFVVDDDDDEEEEQEEKPEQLLESGMEEGEGHVETTDDALEPGEVAPEEDDLNMGEVKEQVEGSGGGEEVEASNYDNQQPALQQNDTETNLQQEPTETEQQNESQTAQIQEQEVDEPQKETDEIEEAAPELIPQLTEESKSEEEAVAPERDLEMPVLEEEEPNVPNEDQEKSEEAAEESEKATDDAAKTQEEDFQDQSNEASEVQDQTSLTDSHTQDENSQSSQTSSNKQQESLGEGGAPTKISILDDWEDTDSQQSEHVKSGATVNKLMDDWADEEEDESKKNAV